MCTSQCRPPSALCNAGAKASGPIPRLPGRAQCPPQSRPSGEFEHAHLPVGAAHSGHLRVRRKVSAEDRLWQLHEGSKGLGLVPLGPVEELALVLLRATCDHHGARRVLAELRGKEHASVLRRGCPPLHSLSKLTGGIVPDLQGILSAPRASEDLTAIRGEVHGVAAEVAVPERAHRVASARVPDLHGVVPATGEDDVGFRGVVLQREDPVGVARRVLQVTTLERLHLLLRHLVVNPHDAVTAGRCELATIAEIVEAEDLVPALGDRVQTLAGLYVPVQYLPVELGIHRYQDALGLGLC
mmetsp:Transcript_25406/g.69353  ORF Transcript_25406/g.69353 Transcript_25406/m.69353 type:complete len:299 (-) Transcript_25406:326-1222(-)